MFGFDIDDLNKAQWSWILYDLGSFGFATATLTTIMPIFFTDGPAHDLSPHSATALWGYSLGTASLCGACLSPIVGATADARSCRRLLVAVAVCMACASAMLFSYSTDFGVNAAAVLLAMTAVCYQLSISLYSSLLPCLFSREQVHRVSPIGTAFSQLGGGLVISMVYLIHHRQSDSISASKVQMMVAGAAMWWLFFTGILMHNVKEPKITRIVGNEIVAESSNPIARLLHTFTEIKQYRDLMRFITAGFFIGEGSGVIFHMSVIYAVTVCKISYSTVLSATIFSRFIGVFFALGWGQLVQTKAFGPQTPRHCYLIVIGLLVLACLVCAALSSPWQYWLLATLLSCAGTGAFSFSRSLLASLCPPDKAAEFFGYSAMIGHVAGFLGPLVFATVVHLTATPRSGFLVILCFLVLGSFLFLTTDFERGQELANGQPCTNLADAKTTSAERAEKAHLLGSDSRASPASLAGPRGNVGEAPNEWESHWEVHATQGNPNPIVSV